MKKGLLNDVMEVGKVVAKPTAVVVALGSLAVNLLIVLPYALYNDHKRAKNKKTNVNLIKTEV